MSNISKKTLNLVQTSILISIILVMAFVPFIGYIPIGFTEATIIHIPVIIGSVVLGPKKGTLLGSVFGITSIIISTIRPSITSFVFSPFYSVGEFHGNFFSIIVSLVPRILVGIVPYYIFISLDKIMSKLKNHRMFSLSIAGAIGSLINTVLTLTFIYVFFGQSYASATNISIDMLYKLILSIILINGIPECIIAAVVTAITANLLLKYNKKFY